MQGEKKKLMSILKDERRNIDETTGAMKKKVLRKRKTS